MLIIFDSLKSQGPDGTCGFHEGWTDRISEYVVEEVQDEKYFTLVCDDDDNQGVKTPLPDLGTLPPTEVENEEPPQLE